MTAHALDPRLLGARADAGLCDAGESGVAPSTGRHRGEPFSRPHRHARRRRRTPWALRRAERRQLFECLALAALLHLLLVLWLGSAPGGSARPGGGIGGSLNVTLRGYDRPRPATFEAATTLPQTGPAGTAAQPRIGGVVRSSEQSPRPDDGPGAARLGTWAPAPEAAAPPAKAIPLQPPDVVPPVPTADAASLPAPERPPPWRDEVPPALSPSAPAAAEPAKDPPAAPTAAAEAPPPLSAISEPPAPVPREAPPVAAQDRAPASPPSAPVLPALPALSVPAPIEPDALPLPAPASMPAPARPAPEAAAAPAAAPAEPSSRPAPPRVAPSGAPGAAMPATGPDAGPLLGHDVATPPASAASTPTPLNLQLARPRGGELSGRMAPGALPLLPRPPERPSKLANDIENAARRDCRTAHAGMGLLATVPLAADALSGAGCKW